MNIFTKYGVILKTVQCLFSKTGHVTMQYEKHCYIAYNYNYLKILVTMRFGVGGSKYRDEIWTLKSKFHMIFGPTGPNITGSMFHMTPASLSYITTSLGYPIFIELRMRLSVALVNMSALSQPEK